MTAEQEGAVALEEGKATPSRGNSKCEDLVER